jgi:K+-transporting ATPase KdpF subunit
VLGIRYSFHKIDGPIMITLYCIMAVVVAALFIYLAIALLKPEIFP